MNGTLPTPRLFVGFDNMFSVIIWHNKFHPIEKPLSILAGLKGFWMMLTAVMAATSVNIFASSRINASHVVYS